MSRAEQLDLYGDNGFFDIIEDDKGLPQLSDYAMQLKEDIFSQKIE